MSRQFSDLIKKIGTLRGVPEGALYDSVARQVVLVQSAARLGVPGQTGELRNSIYALTEVIEGGIRGTCYTDKEYAPYVEFGTGPIGEQKHDNISPAVQPVYTQNPWWIHESQIDRADAERYGWFFVDTPDGRFYQCVGQAAQPFMYPALKSREDTIVRNIGADIRKEMEKV